MFVGDGAVTVVFTFPKRVEGGTTWAGFRDKSTGLGGNSTALINQNAHSGAKSRVASADTSRTGATEEVCIQALERLSGKKWKKDFFVGYSPERINPGDKARTLRTIVKIVSGDTPDTLATLAAVYGSVVDAGIFEASSIRVAEAAKVIENSQRDINIAFMNELAIIFDKMGLDTAEVLEDYAEVSAIPPGCHDA